MRSNYHKRFYSPQFSETASVSVRRLAWALGGSMVQAVDAMLFTLPSLVDSSKVCLSCRDKTRCSACIFSGGAVPSSQLLDLTK